METVHPTNPRIYDTFMDAILAGAMKPNLDVDGALEFKRITSIQT